MHNTTVAKLLAKENIEVQYGNYKTAWFDIQNRTLGLPLWKDMGKDVHDLFVGHEVGHALYTPYEGWHDTPEKLEGCPRSYINVVEDARIEKKIRREYPGLVGPMARAYKVLANDEFFGDLSDIDWDVIKLIDKINLKAKLGSLIDVPFNDDEYNLFKKTMLTETFEDVVELVKEILAYTQENTPELITKPESQLDETNEDEPTESNQSDDPTSNGHDDYINNNGEEDDKGDSQTESRTDEEAVDGDESQEQNSSGSKDQEAKELQNEKPAKVEATKTPDEAKVEDESITDMIFRNAEERLIETDSSGLQEVVGRDRGNNTISSSIVSYDDLAKSRKDLEERHGYEDILVDYKTYMTGVKKSVAVAAKEFEMKKAAFQWQRASSAKTGMLDTNACHAYKTNDDIFKRVTHLADAKNHGLMMIIDFSGSMQSTMPHVLDQVIHLSTFCKTVNIPFDVYAFTTGYNDDDYDSLSYKSKDGEVDFDNLKMPLLVSSSLKKAQYEEAIQYLYKRKAAGEDWQKDYEDRKGWYERSYVSKAEEYGSTPLNSSLMVTHHLIKKFRKVHAIDKMNLVVISDGDSNGLNVYRDYNLNDHHAPVKSTWTANMKIIIDGKLTKVSGGRYGATGDLLKSIQKRYGVTTVGFFIAQDRHDWNTKLMSLNANRDNANKEYNKTKVAQVNAKGYDKFFMLKGGKNLSTENETELNTEMSTSQLKSGFKKLSKGKKNSKVLMKQFGGIVA